MFSRRHFAFAAALVDRQQRAADRLFRPGVLPKAVEVRGAVWSGALA